MTKRLAKKFRAEKEEGSLVIRLCRRAKWWSVLSEAACGGEDHAAMLVGGERRQEPRNSAFPG
jgi:hypothetical protein